MSSSSQLTVRATPSNDLVHLNLVYVKSGTFQDDCQYVQIGTHVFTVSPHSAMEHGEVALNGIQRKSVKASLGDAVEVRSFSVPSRMFTLENLTIEVDFVVKRSLTMSIDGERFQEAFRRRYNEQIYTVGQTWVMDFEGTNILLTCLDVSILDEDTLQIDSQTTLTERHLMGIVGKETRALLKVGPNAGKTLKFVNMPLSTSSRSSEIFKKDFNFEMLGIGGLGKEFGNIIRRAFASRIFPASVLARMGIAHVKGILLYGPPGTGKTLMARQIGKMLNCKDPKIVNGPEVLNKYVGQSEENIRALFGDAEKESAEKGEDSDLHLIIFDEIDAICKQRGSSRDGTGVGDSVVNQLLSKIDGVEALNNVLLIGMTNRKDLIDEALMRPGRFEVQIEIGLPDVDGREEIFKIHTSKLRLSKCLDENVDNRTLAMTAKNFSGAEIEGVVKSAASFAFNRQVDMTNLSKPINADDIRVTQDDFDASFDDVKAAFGVEEEELEKYIRNGLFDYGAEWQRIQRMCTSFVHQLNTSSRITSLSVLVEGPPGSGKTAVAAHLAKSSGFPYVKVLSGESLVGYTELGKCNLIRKSFEDAYKSPFSVVVLDDLERLVEYVALGPRFSNTILQTLLVYIKKQPPKGKQLLVLGTTSQLDVLRDMELDDVFNATLTVPALNKAVGELDAVLGIMQIKFASQAEESLALEMLPPQLGMKTFILILEMARALADEAGTLVTSDMVEQALATCGHRARSV